MKVFIRSSILFILLGLMTFFSSTICVSPGMPMGGINIESNNLTDFLGIIFIIIGILLIFTENKKDIIMYSKCPKCKEVFTYSELKDGICPTCDIKTIDMEKYYDNK